ncbi:MFS transporter [Vagococcus xieshaowenii]|uniref:MFS transporter n=1 Tax=Vagococcus xieshaowenii TaxID=2562451 RepID=A0AAJ5EDG3_9ENTE|nr:MFS transporter [Vagococcus xieshaowenii]QCA28151.1 MFS transporter [Vagococcus xieshaowenii]TFZ39723.1 MFS transporter [Vagococcus xieshaowenii]
MENELEKTKENKKNFYMLLAIFIGYSCIYLDKTAISLSMVSIGESLNMTASQKGLILSIFFLGYTIFQIPYSYLSNKIGSRKVLITSIIGVGIFMILFGFGTSVLYLILIRFFTGSFAHAGYPSAVSSFISQEVSDEKKGSVQSTMIASSGFAAIIGPPLIAILFGVFDWNTTYLILGCMVVLVGIYMMFAIPKDVGQPIVQEGNQKSLSFGQVLKDSTVWIMICAAFFINAGLYGLNSWLPSYLSEEFSLSMSMVSVISVLMGVGTLAAGMLGGIIVNSYFRGKEKRVILIAALLGALFVFMVSKSHSVVISVVLITLCTICSTVAFSTLMSLPVKLFSNYEVSSKYATINAIGVSGGFVAPTVMGAMVEATGGYSSAFLFIMATLICSGIFTMLIKAKRI